jgi:1,4-dihydroxy-2-naphthoate polyprenyltransferase
MAAPFCRSAEKTMNNSSGAAALASIRLPFLTLPPVCVALGTATASYLGYGINYTYLVLILVGALAAHMGVNALNEYDDFRTGLDLKTQRTPFSGGSGFLPQAPEKAHIPLITGALACLTTAGIGFFFVHVRGQGLLPLGLLGLLVIIAYTRVLTRGPLSCLIAPGLGFGPLMVMGTEFVLTGRYSFTGMLVSLVPFFLVNNLLLLNQFPDVDPDREVGRRHLPIVIGRRASSWVYVLFLAGAYATVIGGYLLDLIPVAGLLALATLLLAVPTVVGIFRHAESVPDLIPHMGRSVIIVLLTPVLLAVGLFISA